MNKFQKSGFHDLLILGSFLASCGLSLFFIWALITAPFNFALLLVVGICLMLNYALWLRGIRVYIIKKH